MAGQSINDRLTAARYSIAGQGLAKSVCKATTEEVIGPKKKHLDYLLQCTNEPNVSIPQLANLLIERTQNQAWVIVFKALITVHTLMCYGNERFTQYLASSNCKFNLSGFLDKTGTAGAAGATPGNQPQLSYDMSTFIRRYAKYINEKAISYRTVAFDFCKVKRGKDEGAVRTMNTDQLLKTLPILQAHLDALLDFDCTSSELNNGVINAAFMLLFRDLIRLFACYNDGIINLLEKYFEMNKKQCRDALDCYKKFLIRMDRVSEFLKVAEAAGLDKGGVTTSLSQAPSSLLDALEGHLASLEGKKPPTSTTPAAASNQFESVLTALSSTSASFGLASSNGTSNGAAAVAAATNGSGGTAGATANGGGLALDELTKQQALAEEEAMYEKLRAEAAKNNPFLSSPASEAPSATSAAAASDASQIIDLFAADAVAQPDLTSAQGGNKASDDLLQLAGGNPFADMMSVAAAVPPLQQPYTNGYTAFSSQMGQGFVSDNAFAAVFGGSIAPATTHNTFDGFGDILKPESGAGGGVGSAVPSLGPAGGPPTAPAKLISGDLDSSLSSLVDNLIIKGPAAKPQWQSPKTPNKTGGVNWTPPGPTHGNFARPQQQPQQQQWAGGAMSGGGGMMATGQPVMAAPTGQHAAAGAQQPAPAFDPFGAL